MRRAFEREAPFAGAGAEILALAALVVPTLLLGGAGQTGALLTGLLGSAALCLYVAGGGTMPRIRGEWLLLLAVPLTVMALQLLPLPRGVTEWLSPLHARLSGGATGPAALSLDPPATAESLVRWLGACCGALVLAGRAARAREARSRLLRLLVGLAALVAFVGLLHRAFGVTELFGVRAFEVEHPLPSFFGNPNHLGGFCLLGGFTAVGLALEASELRPRLVLGASALLSLAAVPATESAGAVVSLGVATVALALALALKRGRGTALLGGLALLSAAGLAIGVGAALRSDPEAFLRGKAVALELGLQAIRDAALTGIGAGAFETSHTLFAEAPLARRFTHVENGVVQALADLGVLGGGLLLVLVAGLWLRLLRVAARTPSERGVVAGLAGLLVHNLADFSLALAPGAWAAALLFRSSHDDARADGRRRLPRALGAIPLAACVGLALFARPSLERETELLLASTALGTALPAARLAAAEATARRPADPLPFEALAARELREPRGAGPALRAVNQLLLRSPGNPAAHLLAAEALLRAGRRSQGLLELRLAAIDGLDVAELLIRVRATPAEVLEATPDALEPSRRLVRRLLDLGPSDLARPVAERSVARADAGEEDRRLLLSVLEAGKEWELALSLLRSWERDVGQRPWLAIREAELLRAAGRPDEARARLERGLRQHPDDRGLRLAAARLAIAAGAPEEALSLSAGIVEPLTATERALLHDVRWRALSSIGRREAAIEELRIARRLAPRRTDLAIDLANLYVEEGRLEEAKTELDSVEPTTPGHAAARARIAALLRRWREQPQPRRRRRAGRSARR